MIMARRIHKARRRSSQPRAAYALTFFWFWAGEEVDGVESLAEGEGDCGEAVCFSMSSCVWDGWSVAVAVGFSEGTGMEKCPLSVS